MTGIAMDAARPIVRLARVAGASLLLGLGLACSSGPAPESSGIPGFEPTMKTVAIGANDHFSVLDSNDVIVRRETVRCSAASSCCWTTRNSRIVATSRRCRQGLPSGSLSSQRTARRWTASSKQQGARRRVEHVIIPRDREGNPLPIARFSSHRSAARWRAPGCSAPTRAAGPGPLQDWIVAGVHAARDRVPELQNPQRATRIAAR
jgi:hypothetical protein